MGIMPRQSVPREVIPVVPAPPIVIFDIDGTLIDSRPGVISSLMHVAENVGVRVGSRESLNSCVGPPLAQVFSDRWKLDGDGVQHAMRLYREHYLSAGVLDSRVYDGIVGLLRRLRCANASLAVATAKPASEATSLLKAHRLDDYFLVVEGAVDHGDTGAGHKKVVVERALDRLRSDAPAVRPGIMVGDRKFDVMAARECGLTPIGVLYGYGSRKELRMAGARVVASSVPSLSVTLDKLFDGRLLG